MKLDFRAFVLVGALGILAVGCNKQEPPTSASGMTNTGAAPAGSVGANSLEGADAAAGRGGATVVHSVPKDGHIPEGGLVITPPNPNDPRYKPAPGMGGGG